MTVLDRLFSRPRAIKFQREGERSGPVTRPRWASAPVRAISGNPNLSRYRLYRLLVENIPPLARALEVYGLLCGELRVDGDGSLPERITEFLSRLRVGPHSQGVRALQAQHSRDHLLYGISVWEMVPSNAGRDIYGVLPVDPDTLVITPRDGNPFDLEFQQIQRERGGPVPLPSEWLLVTAAGDDELYGRSMLASLPFVAEILLKVEEAHSKTWERYGTPPYHVNLELPEGWADPDGSRTQQLLAPIQEAWREAMAAQKAGSVRDFFSAGRVRVEVIGADGEALPFEVTYRALMEQVVSATGLPPWLLGFSWSTTERLSDNQADVLSEQVRGLQAELMPLYRRLVDTYMAVAGLRGEYDLRFEAVSLYDLQGRVDAEVKAAQAAATREATARRLWEAGVFDQRAYARFVLGEDDVEVATPVAMPPGAGPVQTMEAGCSCHTKRATFQGIDYGEEKPKTRQQADAIERMYRDIVAAWDECERAVMRALGVEMASGDRTLDEFDDAIDRFVERLVGRSGLRTTAEQFVDGEGLIQEWDRFAYALGINRATELSGAEAAAVLPARNSEAIRRLLSDAFDRLSENGRLRIGSQLEGIRDVLRQGLERGDNPLDIAERLRQEFTGYRDYEWQRLARTEVSFAHNRGMLDEFQAEGYDAAGVAGDPPPWHPNCLCALTIDPQSRRVTYDVATTACPVCLAYRGR